MTTMSHGESIPNQVMGDTKHPRVDILTAGKPRQGARIGVAEERAVQQPTPDDEDLLKSISALGYAERHTVAGGRAEMPTPHLLVIALEPTQSALHACLSESYHVTTRTSADFDTGQIADLAPDAIVVEIPFGCEAPCLAVLEQLQTDAVAATVPTVVCASTRLDREQIHTKAAEWASVMVEQPIETEALLATVKECLRRTQAPVAPGTAKNV